MQPLPLFLKQLQTVQDFFFGFGLFDWIASVGVVISIAVHSQVQVQHLLKFFHAVADLDGFVHKVCFALIFNESVVFSLIAHEGKRLVLLMRVVLIPLGFESGLQALKSWRVFFVDFDDHGVVTLSNGLKLRPDDGGADLVLSRPQQVLHRLVGQISINLGLEDAGWLGQGVFVFGEQPLGLSHVLIINKMTVRCDEVNDFICNNQQLLQVCVDTQLLVFKMSSESDQHSSSSKRQRSRSRSRDRKHERSDNRDRKIRIKVPELKGQLYTYRRFKDLQADKVTEEVIQKGYDRYKKDWDDFQSQDFLNEYKKDAWFAERYDPEVLDILERDRKENNRKNCQEFMSKLSDGWYDDINLTVRDPEELGVVAQVEEEVEFNFCNFIINQTIEIHMLPTVDISKKPYYGFDPDANTLFIKTVPRKISRYDIRPIVEKFEGYKSISMSDPIKKMNLNRYCWLEFNAEDSCNKALLGMSGLMIKEEKVELSQSHTKIRRCKVLKNYPVTRLETDIATMVRLIQKLDSECGIETTVSSQQFTSNHHKFDILILYLRRVHAYDYFTSTSYENERILTLKIGSVFLRLEADYEELEGVQTVFKKIQENAEKRIEKKVEAVEYMSLVKEEIEKMIKEKEDLVVSKDPKDLSKEAWKCIYCDKKFKSCEFLAKHMIVKHEDVKMKKVQVVMERIYQKDPSKITYLTLRDDRDYRGRRTFTGGFRKEKRREMYKDFDEPEGASDKAQKGAMKPMVNFLDI